MPDIKNLIRTIENYPKPGILFRDVTTLLKDPKGFQKVIQTFVEKYQNQGITQIVGIEARGFILGAALASHLQIGFVPLRKKGKLPGQTLSQTYELEYGIDQIELHIDALSTQDRVVIVDDLIATGGTLDAGISLVEQTGATIVSCCAVIDLPDLEGSARVRQRGYEVYTVVDFPGH